MRIQGREPPKIVVVSVGLVRSRKVVLRDQLHGPVDAMPGVIPGHSVETDLRRFAPMVGCGSTQADRRIGRSVQPHAALLTLRDMLKA